jgi:hypothetical protein
MKQLLLLMTMILMVVPSVGYAQIVETNTLFPGSESGLPLPPSASDLVLQGSSTFSSITSNYVPFSNGAQTWGPVGVLNDGSLGSVDDNNSAAFELNGVFNVTFNLNTSVNTQGYNLTGIESFAGWSGDGSDDPRVGQAYTVLYSTVANPTSFISLGSVSYQPFSTNASAGRYSTEVNFNATSGFLASDVAAVEFQIVDPSTYVRFAATDVSTMYRELDVQGAAVATVPEPSSYVLLGAGLLSLFIFRRQARMNA